MMTKKQAKAAGRVVASFMVLIPSLLQNDGFDTWDLAISPRG